MEDLVAAYDTFARAADTDSTPPKGTVDMHTLSKPDGIEEVTDRLAGRLRGNFPRAALLTRVRRQFAALQEAPIRDFVPLFVERRVRAELGRTT